MFESKVRRLVETFSTSNISDIELDRTIRKTARLLSSNTSYRGQESYQNIVQKITKLINQNDNKSHEKSLYFLEIAQKLQSSPHLMKKPEILQLLQLLSENSNISSHSNLMSYQHSNQLSNNPSFASFTSSLSSSNINNNNNNNNNNNHRIHSNTNTNNMRLGEVTNTTNNVLLSSSTTTTSPSQTNILRPYANNKLQQEQYITDLSINPIHRIDAPYNTNFDGPGLNGEIVDELLLIRDILYCSQGIETELIETRNNEFEAKSKLRLMPSQKRLVRRLCQIGKFHDKLTKFIKQHRLQSDGGLVLQSFLGSLDEELTSLYELFGCLHEKLEKSFNQNCKISEKMTLERLNIWFNEPLLRLNLLNKYCSSIKGSKGGMIISQIYKFCRTGNEFEHNFTESILNEISRPIFDMIGSWIIEGQLNDPFNEFFIVEMNDIDIKPKDIWKKKYILIRKYIPIFINKNLAKQIYSIGRNLNFIRCCCRDNKYDSSFNYNSLINNDKINICNLNEFEAQINKLSEITNKYLMNLMMNKFKVMIHAEALRKYLLLGQGDFIQQFLIEITDEMNKNASCIKIHDIQSKLESAILQSNALYDDNDIKQRLKVKIMALSSGDIGWNVFSLNYFVDLPINIIFNENLMKKYQKVFIFLMKIKRAKSVLNDSWSDQMRGNHQISIFPDIHYIKHCGYLVRNSMNELLQIFESYFMFDVLDASWKAFKQNVNDTKTMDGLIAAHSKYINEIIKKCFLLNQNDDEQKLKKPFEDILVQIHHFCMMYKELYQQLNNIQNKRDETLKLIQKEYDQQNNIINLRDSYVGTTVLFDSQTNKNRDIQYQNQYNKLRKKQTQIIDVLKSFHNKIAKLLELPKTNKIIPEYLERLLVQLDFNDFHLNLKTQQTHLLSIDLPINPLPIETFIKHKNNDNDNNNKKTPNNSKNKKITKSSMNIDSYDSSSNNSNKSRKSSKSNKYSQNNNNNIRADDMLSKLDAVLNPINSTKSDPSSSSTKPYVPNFVFPSFGNNESKNNDNDHHFNQHRTTAPSSTNFIGNDAMIPTPIKQENKKHDILSKYNLGTTPKIDSRIPHHLLPTPLQKNKTNSKTSDISTKYLFDDSIIDTSTKSRSRNKTRINDNITKRSRSSSPHQHRFDFHHNQLNELYNNNNDDFSYKPRTNGSGYIDDENFDHSNNSNNNQNEVASPSAIKFSFGDQIRDEIKPMMSPIPFARDIGKIDNNHNIDKDQWSRFIPTPLMNQRQKTKTYR